MPSAGFDLDVGWTAEVAEEHWLLYAMARVKVQIYDGGTALFHARPARFQRRAHFCPAHGLNRECNDKAFPEPILDTARRPSATAVPRGTPINMKARMRGMWERLRSKVAYQSGWRLP
jgi:hypothetical protein